MTNLRYLRLKYKIPLQKLADMAGVSPQYINRIELSPHLATAKDTGQIALAIEQLIRHDYTQLAALEQEFLYIKGRLFNESQEDAP
ncbi:helix-turn-helix transcriptional regulator [Bengtsoniella intestinalis]|uniref:helix-turn-helix domain-containing protein n=1 Tax=Bengtsoniella intestinalis TaxID=3073143 RepID=UPI00391EF0F5